MTEADRQRLHAAYAARAVPVHSPLPWSAPSNKPVLDALGEPVSVAENLEFLLWVVQRYWEEVRT